MSADQAQQAVLATARSLTSQLKYANTWIGATLAQLKTRKAGDCSDFTQAVYGSHGYTIGSMSYQQANDGVEVASWRGNRGGANAAFIAIQSHLKPADLICMAIDSSRPGVISHVEIWIGDGISIGHGGPGYGPTEHAITSWSLLQSATYWTVRRIIPNDQPQEEDDMYTDADRTRDNKIATRVEAMAKKVNAVYDGTFITTPTSRDTRAGTLGTLKAIDDALFKTDETSFGTPGGVLKTLRLITDKLGITQTNQEESTK
jgi:hypothetical protein